MLIRKHCGSKRRCNKPMAVQSAPAGFTLVELLVVISIIALLISILLPSLREAREQARKVVCGSQMRGLSTGMLTYTSENQDWLPGMNTTGVRLLSKKLLWSSGHPEAIFQGDMPVQTTDWMTPILSLTTRLPVVRADRWWLLWEEYQCPAHKRYKSVLWEDGLAAPDYDDFEEKGLWPTASYKMSVHFQYYGQSHREKVLGHYEHPTVKVPIRAQVAPASWEVVNDEYIPRLDRVGSPAGKLFIADGTRYLPQSLVLDHDISPVPEKFGGFTCSGAWWCGSTAYGVRAGSAMYPTERRAPTGSPSRGQNLRLSYRHGRASDVISGEAQRNTGQINAAFFDGHVEALSDERSRRIDYWYPKGGVVAPSKRNEGMTALPGSASENYVVP